MKKTLLPLGTILILKGSDQKLMIVSRVVQMQTKETFDYMCVLWPNGFIGEEHQYFINHEDVRRVCHQGYSDSEDIEYLLELAEFNFEDEPVVE